LDYHETKYKRNKTKIIIATAALRICNNAFSFGVSFLFSFKNDRVMNEPDWALLIMRNLNQNFGTSHQY
jgi:hypothetical protein